MFTIQSSELLICLKRLFPTVCQSPTHPVVQVFGQRVDEDKFSGGCGSIQADGCVKVGVPKHGASQQSDEKGDDQHRQQGDEPTQHRYGGGTG